MALSVLFITLFIIFLIDVIIKLVYIHDDTYPRKNDRTMGKDVADVLLTVIFLFWIGFVAL